VRRNVQAYSAKDDDQVEVEEVGDAQGEAEDYAEHSCPMSPHTLALLPLL